MKYFLNLTRMFVLGKPVTALKKVGQNIMESFGANKDPKKIFAVYEEKKRNLITNITAGLKGEDELKVVKHILRRLDYLCMKFLEARTKPREEAKKKLTDSLSLN